LVAALPTGAGEILTNQKPSTIHYVIGLIINQTLSHFLVIALGGLCNVFAGRTAFSRTFLADDVNASDCDFNLATD
jgi:hypothetical protein